MRRHATVVALGMLCLLGSALEPADAGAEEARGRWSLALRGGASLTTQDVAVDVEANTGFVLSGVATYRLADFVALGLNLDWERRDIESFGVDVGELTTFSILPFVELRPATGGAVSPYGFLGLGFNINSIDVAGDFNVGCQFLFGANCEIEPDDTLAVKLGGGLDVRISNAVAINLEMNWKSNDGNQEIRAGGVPVGTDDFKASSFSLLAGLRVLF